MRDLYYKFGRNLAVGRDRELDQIWRGEEKNLAVRLLCRLATLAATAAGSPYGVRVSAVIGRRVFSKQNLEMVCSEVFCGNAVCRHG